MGVGKSTRYEAKTSVKRRKMLSAWRGYHEPRPLPEARAISDLVGEVVKSLKLDDHLNTEKVAQLWSKVVGEPYASLSRPVSYKRGVLTVAVNQPTAHYSIRGAKDNIMQRLSEQLGSEISGSLKDIKFRVGS